MEKFESRVINVVNLINFRPRQMPLLRVGTKILAVDNSWLLWRLLQNYDFYTDFWTHFACIKKQYTGVEQGMSIIHNYLDTSKRQTEKEKLRGNAQSTTSIPYRA